ncbi:proteoglycan 4 [Stegastes partitus]|uniref:Proteoglycan 4 n=1 Tax=Stegastes partitus TaxID=144197 RepID=A0A9Y4KG59_9TELE|nr:PREDICTED: proteoglycan 4 [Stegastes partitus]
MYRRMSSTLFYAVVLLACALKFSSSQTSCKGRCGAEYYRGYMCQCDFTCLAYGECCSDFESQCTTKNSCLGRCGEAFKRGRLCSCDPDCVKYKQCCPDFKLHCDAEDQIMGASSATAPGKTNSCNNVNDNKPKDTVVDAVDQPSTFSEGNDADDYVVPLDGPTESPTDELGMNSKISPVDDFSNNGVEELEASPIPESTSGYGSTPADLLVQGSTEPTLVTDTMEFTTEPAFTAVPPSTEDSTTIPDSSSLDSTAAPEETTPNPDADVPTGPPTALVDVEDDSTGVSPQGSELDVEATNLPSSTDDVTPDITTADPLKPLDVEQTSNMDDTRGYQGDDSNDTNLCSGRPVGAVTTLRNGTTVVFRGHYFWYLDRNRVPGPAQGITQVWGVPSPVDTVFTRCNCQGKTYIFKGNQYWRFENDALDVGYPKAVSTGFDGLRGHITAALSVPQHRSRRESVYFFKRGGYVQKYSYQFGTSPTCSRKPQYAIYTVRNRVARQAVSVLEPAINIRTSWRGFPSTITAAVSIPNNQEPEGYKYYVISRTKTYNVRMSGERPVLAAPKANAPPQANDVFKCPKKV